MYLARSRPTVLTWFTDASLRGLQHLHSGTLRPSGGVHMGSSRERVAPLFRQCRSRRGADGCSSDHDGVARPSRDRAGLGAGNRRMKMAESVGLDVSMKETAVSIRRDGKRIWRGTCGSDPRLIAEVIRRRAPRAARVVFETGPLSVWFSHALTAEGLPAICIDARHAKAALDMAPNKTEAHDADGLAQLAEVGFFREVRVKGFDSMLGRTLVAARNRLVQITTELSNQIRGLMKTFGLVVPAGKGSRFEAHVRALLADQEGLAPILLPLLEAWRAVRLRAAELGRQLVASARRSEAYQILMSVPGVGAVTATSFATAVEDPENFRRSRSVGAWLGLTTRRDQSGEVDS